MLGNYLFFAGSRFVESLGIEKVVVKNVPSLRIKTSEKTFSVLPEADLIYASTDRQLISSMVRGNIDIKNKLSWWHGWTVLRAVLNDYFVRYNYLGRAIEDIKDFEKSLADIPLENRTNESGERAAHLIERLWHSLPDSESIHSLPRFGLLCDLCSEAWVFQPEETE